MTNKRKSKRAVHAGPHSSPGLRRLEELVARLSGLETFPWKSITVKIARGCAPIVAAEFYLPEEDLAAAMENPGS